jgi:hypothetical protein
MTSQLLSKKAIAILLLTFSQIAGAGPAKSHSWYPQDCCSNQDCMPADDVMSDHNGDLVVRVGSRRIWVPRGFAIRPSKDDRIHICFRADENKFLMPLCLFRPAQG